jgi:hypothetical protein
MAFEVIKKHPFMFGGGVVVLLLLFMMLRGGGGGGQAVASSAPGADPAVVAAGTQLQIAQMGASAHAADVTAAAQAQSSQTAAAVTIATLQAALQGHAIDVGAQTAALQAQLQTQASMQANTLSAGIQAAGIKAQTDMAALSEATAVHQMDTMAAMNAANQQTLISAQTIAANKDISIAQIAADTSKAQTQAQKEAQINKQNQAPWYNPFKIKCYLTTACCERRGLPDDCFELTMMRKFRDEYVINLPGGHDIIGDYYKTAPKIVDAINEHKDAVLIWNRLYTGFITPCVYFVEHGDNESAYAVYSSMTKRLKVEYLGHAT